MVQRVDRYDPTALWGPNLVLLAFVALYLLGLTCDASRRVERVAQTKEVSAGRVDELERLVGHGGPGAGWAALELSRLYGRAGAFAWSYDALRSAEANGPRDPGWQLKLGLAYVESGHNADGRRVLSHQLRVCEVDPCPANVQARLQLFLGIVERMIERKIDARYDLVRTDEVFREVLKPAESAGLSPKDRRAAGAPERALRSDVAAEPQAASPTP